MQRQPTRSAKRLVDDMETPLRHSRSGVSCVRNDIVMSMQSGPIYLIGPSGNPNFGDEFIAASWLKYLAVERPDADVWLDCPQPGLAQVLFEGLHPRLRVTNTLWRLVHETADLSLDDAADLIRARVTGLGSPSYDERAPLDTGVWQGDAVEHCPALR